VHRSKSGPLMSESGQTRSFGDVCSMSGLPPKAAVERTSVDVPPTPAMVPFRMLAKVM
jgi:hypothetical protein